MSSAPPPTPQYLGSFSREQEQQILDAVRKIKDVERNQQLTAAHDSVTFERAQDVDAPLTLPAFAEHRPGEVPTMIYASSRPLTQTHIDALNEEIALERAKQRVEDEERSSAVTAAAVASTPSEPSAP